MTPRRGPVLLLLICAAAVNLACGAQPLTVEQAQRRFGVFSRHAGWLLPQSEVAVTGVLVVSPRCITKEVCRRECCGCSAQLELGAADPAGPRILLLVSGLNCSGDTCGAASCEEATHGARYTARGTFDGGFAGVLALRVASLESASGALLPVVPLEPRYAAAPRWVVPSLLAGGAFIAGLFLVATVVGRWRRRRPSSSGGPLPVSPPPSRGRPLTTAEVLRFTLSGVLFGGAGAVLAAVITAALAEAGVSDAFARIGALALGIYALPVGFVVGCTWATHGRSRRAAGLAPSGGWAFANFSAAAALVAAFIGIALALRLPDGALAIPALMTALLASFLGVTLSTRR